MVTGRAGVAQCAGAQRLLADRAVDRLQPAQTRIDVAAERRRQVATQQATVRADRFERRRLGRQHADWRVIARLVSAVWEPADR